SSSSFCMVCLLLAASGRAACSSGTGAPMRNGRSGTERAPGRCAGPLAATPIATDLPGRVLRPSPAAEVRAARTGDPCASRIWLRQACGTVMMQGKGARGGRLRHGGRGGGGAGDGREVRPAQGRGVDRLVAAA